MILTVDQASVALVYFLIASVYLLLSLLLYLFVSKHKFYVHFATTQRQSIGKTETPYHANIKEVAFKVWIPALTVLLVYLVTLGDHWLVKIKYFFVNLFRHLSIIARAGCHK